MIHYYTINLHGGSVIPSEPHQPLNLPRDPFHQEIDILAPLGGRERTVPRHLKVLVWSLGPAGVISKNENPVRHLAVKILKEPLQSCQDCISIRLSQGHDNDTAMLWMNQWHCVIEISIRSQNHRTQILRTFKDHLVIRPEFTDIHKWDHFMSGGFNDIHSRLREILVQQNPHARAKLYGVSSNLASDPAKSNTAEMSSDVMLG